MSNPPTQASTATPMPSSTPAPSSPPAPSESFLSDIDGTAPSVLDNSFGAGEGFWDQVGAGEGEGDNRGLNLVSWKLDVNARSEDGVEKRGFNAISTVLNHPTKKANPLRSSRKPLPPLSQPPQPLPRPPPPSHYDNYLQSITPLYDAFIASQVSASGSASGSTSTSAGIGNRVQSPGLTLGEFDGRPPVEAAPTGLPSLNSVPSIFFDPDFDLSNPSTWDELIGSSSRDGINSAENDEDDGRARSAEVQDELSTHLDTLERHLVHEISLRSSSFFSALSNLQDLHSESASCLNRISELQSSLKTVGKQQARKGIEVIDAQEKLRVLKVTERGVKTVGELDEMMGVATRLVDEGDWNGGLSYVEDVVRWWEKYARPKSQGASRRPSSSLEGQGQGDTQPAPSASSDASATLPLSTLPALSTIPAKLQQLTSAIATQLESSLSSFLLSTLSTEDGTAGHQPESFAGQVEPMIVGLVRCGGLDKIESVWRDAVTISVREGSRKHLPVSQGDDDPNDESKPPEARGASLAQSLQAMDHSSFLLLSTQMYSTLLARIQLAQQVGEEIEKILKNVISLPPLAISTFVPDPSSKPTQSLPNFSDVLISACELAHARSSKILAVRSEQHAALALDEFVEMFKENWEFVLASEKLAGRMIVSLRGVTAAQARAFLVSYHAMRLTKSAKLVEEEQWTQIDVVPSVQHVVNLLIQSAVTDPPECFVPPRPPLDAEKTQNEDRVATKQVNIEDKAYFVVKATADSLVLLGDYLKIVINLELVVTDVMSRVIEFLKSFNSRTCQVVLGAGAMRSAGLKNITAKHLALASQSLSIIISLIPYIREFVRRHLSPKQAVMLTEFDKLKRDYQDHQNEIHAKLVAIMSDRLAVHVGSLREIDWEAEPAKDGPRAYAEMLVKETATLHKVLSKYLAMSTVEVVMSEVIGAIVHRLSEEYGKVEFKSEDAKKRMLQDVALITIKLKPLSTPDSSSSSGSGPGSGSSADITTLESIVKDKPTPRKAIGAAMSGLLRRNNSKNASAEVGPGDPGSARNGDGDEDEDEDEDGATLTEEPGAMSAGAIGAESEPPLPHGEADASASEANGSSKGDVTDEAPQGKEAKDEATMEPDAPLPIEKGGDNAVPESEPKPEGPVAAPEATAEAAPSAVADSDTNAKTESPISPAPPLPEKSMNLEEQSPEDTGESVTSVPIEKEVPVPPLPEKEEKASEKGDPPQS
ncbi:hypothetical protein I317_02780 [Kwoniella heveanensis CBS 569]|nr:hypothetical protein I317_02780 [Kwoniella heveanensis CBS 569]